MSIAAEVAAQVPLLRRYARALTGGQASGDSLVKATLQAIIAEPGVFDQTLTARVALYRVFQKIWTRTASGPQSDDATAPTPTDINERLRLLTPARRQALLLTSMEDFSHREAAAILGCPVVEIEEMVRAALLELVAQTPSSVLIIEDEPVISLDLANIVQEMGHTVAAVAATRSEAVAAAAATSPGLVLADIHLADNSSGIDAVNDILERMTPPVIFITAFPERLLTGERSEPAFLVTKPFLPENVKAVIAQALLLADDGKSYP